MCRVDRGVQLPEMHRALGYRDQDRRVLERFRHRFGELARDSNLRLRAFQITSEQTQSTALPMHDGEYWRRVHRLRGLERAVVPVLRAYPVAAMLIDDAQRDL